MAAAKSAKIPSLVYGTAWKKDATRSCVKQAILAGFRGIDTAAQPRHYSEEDVGAGVRDMISEGVVKREDLYIQTKYTSSHGQSRSMPFNPNKSITCQVGQSVESSLKHLRQKETGPFTASTQPYIDCLILHSPFPTMAETKEAWRAMELHVPHLVRTLGLSNVYDVNVLQQIYDLAATKPAVVQNRFYRDTDYDKTIRAFCAEKQITYQSFWTLTANPALMRSDAVDAVMQRTGVNNAVALYALVLGLGKVSVLDGTTNSQRMKEDLEGVTKVQAWAQTSPEAWQEVCRQFGALLED